MFNLWQPQIVLVVDNPKDALASSGCSSGGMPVKEGVSASKNVGRWHLLRGTTEYNEFG